MKGLLISAAMFAALGGTAFAQASSTDTTAPASPAPAAGATAVNPPASTAAAPAPMDNTPSATDQAAPATAPAAPSNGADTAATVMSPSGDYPVCKTRSQDHCQVRSQMTHRHTTRHPSTTSTAPAAEDTAQPNG
jgi:hypothetical protein